MKFPSISKGEGTLLALASVLGSALVLTACATTAASRPPSTSVIYRFGVVGNHGAISQLQLDRPTPVAGISGRIVQIATSNSDGYALTSDGVVWAWGVASFGELGNGTHPAYSTRAVRVDFPTGTRITTLANRMPFGAFSTPTATSVCPASPSCGLSSSR
jgi:hypothetical protein